MYIISPVQGLLEYTQTRNREEFLVSPTNDNQRDRRVSLERNEEQSNRSSGLSIDPKPSSSSNQVSTPNSKRKNSNKTSFLKWNNNNKTQSNQQGRTGKEGDTGGGGGKSGGRMEGIKSLSHPAVWPNVKQHVTTSLAIIKNLTDFAQELSQMYEHHASELQLLVGNYRKKNTEIRKERGVNSCMMQVWEGLLQEVEADAGIHSEIASVLGRQVSRHTLERTFHRKLQARKLLAHRESLDLVVGKAEETLSKCRQEYRGAWLQHCQSPQSTAGVATYLDAHNSYVSQLHATNAMVETYSKETLPDLLQELEDVYADLCNTMSESLSQGAEIISNRTGAQSRRYCAIWSECKEMSPSSDTSTLVRGLVLPSQPHPTHRLRVFTTPQHESDPQDGQAIVLRNEIVTDRLASVQVPQRYESLCEEANNLTAQVQHLQDALSTMIRIQQRSLESSLFNKANEIQEDISMKRYELKTAQLNLASITAQKELFAGKIEMSESGGVGSGNDRKMSSASTASMKSKWLKAFKSLKTPPGSSSGNGPQTKEPEKEKRNGKDINMSTSDTAHQFQEYTYKKITPCDVCSQVLRGHTRQGLKCRLCKLNVHIDCQEKVGKCQTKSRLLRRQKSSSEIETSRPSPNNSEEQALCDVGILMPPTGSGYRSISPGGTSGTGEKSRTVTFKTPEGERFDAYNLSTPLQSPLDPTSSRRKKMFGMRSLSVFGHNKSHDRASSLPETEQVQYIAGTRPFGQPLVLAGGASTSGSPPQTPSPRANKKQQE